MFRQFAALIPGGAPALFQLHPSELVALLELVWRLGRAANPGAVLGHPDHRSDVDGLPQPWLDALLPGAPPPPAAALAAALRRLAAPEQPQLMWDHLIYAYMVENTRIYEIFRRVVNELLHGEKLGLPGPASQNWLRSTEELFYRDPPSFSIAGVASHIRPDLRASRRNAYQRMFGMDLNHGMDDSKPYPYLRAEVANNEFAATFEEFLRELWVGRTHFAAIAGPRPTDDAKIAILAQKLHDMLRSRRLYGNLSREEFVFVSMLSWFHLTVESDLPIIVDLKVEAANAGPEERLFKIAQRVGLPAHGLSKSYFDIAGPISRILIQIETGVYNNPAAVPALYTPSPPAPPRGPEPDVVTIITHWSVITGRDVKAGKVATT
jgi:hypothetical protein